MLLALAGCAHRREPREKHGTQAVTVNKLVRVLARQAAEAALSLTRVEAVRGSTSVPDGNCNVPAFLVTPAVVPKQNVMEEGGQGRLSESGHDSEEPASEQGGRSRRGTPTRVGRCHPMEMSI
jgi:hypothetical protein